MGRVYVLGNAGIDLLLAVPHLAQPGETAVASAARRAPGGKGLNQAAAAARAGAEVCFCAPVGMDAEAEFIAAALGRESLSSLRLLPKPLPTDQSIVMVAMDGENCIVSLCGCADALTDAEATDFVALVGPDDWLLLQGNLSASVTLAAAAAARGRVMLNAAPLRWAVQPLLQHCAILVVNRGEAAQITGCDDPNEAAGRLRAGGCATAIVTLGSAGCLWVGADGAFRMPSGVVSPIDTSGAGDVFCGLALARLVGGMPIRDAIAAAQQAAVLSVTRSGAFDAIPTAGELRQHRGIG